jgi:elongation factor Ts
MTPIETTETTGTQERTTGMANITAEMVRELRDATGAGMMDCKRALTEADGDIAVATAILRERGMAAAGKKSGREVREGLIGQYIHTGGRVGVLIEVNCETDFVARTEQFQDLVRLLAVQVAGLAPLYVDVESIPTADLEAKKADLASDASVAAKPAEIQAKIVDGQLQKWFKEVVLLEQPFRDTDRLVRDIVTEAIATIGENIRVRRFTRYALGEEL